MTKNRTIALITIIVLLFSETIIGQELFYGEVVVKNTIELVNAVNNGEERSLIRVTPGVYELNSSQQLQPKKGMRIIGSGMGMSTIKAANDWDPGLEGLPAHEVNRSAANDQPYLFKIEKTEDVKILNMTLTGTKLHGAIFASDCRKLEFSNLKIQDFVWSSILTYDITDFKVHDCRFHDPGGKVRWMGAAIFSNRTTNGDFFNNKITSSPGNNNRFVGFKARGSNYVRIHHNTVNPDFGGFSVEYMHADNRFIEIDHNHFNGVISIPRGGTGGSGLEGGYSFWIHHNYTTKSYSIEGPRSHLIVENNYFDFPISDDGGNLYTDHSSSDIKNIIIRENQIKNPGRGLFWSKDSKYTNVYINNNHVKANPTITLRADGLIHFTDKCDFTTISVKNNIFSCEEMARPLFRNDISGTATVENNEIHNIVDIERYKNPMTVTTRGLANPMYFKCGFNKEYLVDGWNVSYIGERD